MREVKDPKDTGSTRNLFSNEFIKTFRNTWGHCVEAKKAKNEFA